jgi:hypothetical protein
MIAHRALLAAYVRRRRRVTARTVARAYREIRAVPLHRGSPVRRAGWAAAAAALVVALVSVGVPRLGRRQDGVAVAPAPPAIAAVVPDVAPPVAPPADPASDFERRLAHLDADASARAAVDAVLAAWHGAPLRTDEKVAPDRLERIAWDRSLEDLRMTGNLSMLRLLDLPALLALRIPDTTETRWVALVGLRDGRPVLVAGGEPSPVDPPVLDRLWLGEAHVFWRDFESLGRTFGTEARGPHVVRLQELLARVGVYGGTASGVFDPPTEAAVLDFQRSRLLDADCRVGRLTRIVLYAVAGGYDRPTLVASTRSAS